VNGYFPFFWAEPLRSADQLFESSTMAISEQWFRFSLLPLQKPAFNPFFFAISTPTIPRPSPRPFPMSHPNELPPQTSVPPLLDSDKKSPP
jgi:hypothetical protein